jgi:uncharacterized protein
MPPQRHRSRCHPVLGRENSNHDRTALSGRQCNAPVNSLKARGESTGAGRSLATDCRKSSQISILSYGAKGVEAKALVCYICFMKRDEAINRLQQHEADLKRLGVEHLYMFGSTARGEAKDDSDVDLFFDYEKGKFGLFELMDVKEYAAGILGRKTDIMTRDSLHRMLREKIESTAVRVF